MSCLLTAASNTTSFEVVCCIHFTHRVSLAPNDEIRIDRISLIVQFADMFVGRFVKPILTVGMTYCWLHLLS